MSGRPSGPPSSGRGAGTHGARSTRAPGPPPRRRARRSRGRHLRCRRSAAGRRCRARRSARRHAVRHTSARARHSRCRSGSRWARSTSPPPGRRAGAAACTPRRWSPGRGEALRALRPRFVSRRSSRTQLKDAELAEWLGLSRTPIREALARLEEYGLVETKPKSYTRVAPLSARDARDAFTVYAALEALAASLGVPRLTGADLETMRAANRDFADALGRRRRRRRSRRGRPLPRRPRPGRGEPRDRPLARAAAAEDPPPRTGAVRLARRPPLGRAARADHRPLRSGRSRAGGRGHPRELAHARRPDRPIVRRGDVDGHHADNRSPRRGARVGASSASIASRSSSAPHRSIGSSG